MIFHYVLSNLTISDPPSGAKLQIFKKFVRIEKKTIIVWNFLELKSCIKLIGKTISGVRGPLWTCEKILSLVHPIPGYGQMKRESPDLGRYLPSGSKTIFRDFFWPAKLKISSFEIFWIRLVRKSLFLSSNMNENRLKFAFWVPQIESQHKWDQVSWEFGRGVGPTSRDVRRYWS